MKNCNIHTPNFSNTPASQEAPGASSPNTHSHSHASKLQVHDALRWPSPVRLRCCSSSACCRVRTCRCSARASTHDRWAAAELREERSEWWKRVPQAHQSSTKSCAQALQLAHPPLDNDSPLRPIFGRQKHTPSRFSTEHHRENKFSSWNHIVRQIS